MNTTIRGLKSLIALGALAGLGLLLHWVTAGSLEAATAQDLISMASIAIGAVAWVAYCWLVVAVLATVLEQAPGAIGRSASLVAGRITSASSRTLLRSALGVAAVTPLTIGVAHATPTPAHSHQPTALGTTADAGTGARPWDNVEPQSTIQLRPTPSPHPLTSSAPASATGQSMAPRATRTTGTTGTPAGARPWSAVEPRSTVEITDETPTNWRTPEKPSSLQLAVPTTPAPPSQAHANQPPQPAQPAPQPTAKPATPSATTPGTPAATKPASPASTGKPEQHTKPAIRTNTPIRQHTPTDRIAAPANPEHPAPGRTAPSKTAHPTTAPTDVPATGHPSPGHGRVPETTHPATGRTGVPTNTHPTTSRTGAPQTGHSATGRTGVPANTHPTTDRPGAPETGRRGEVAVPDRPTSGAPTRYTHLQSGRLARAASHVVKTDDSLWTIAAAELGPHASDEAIAARWPQWYEANRQQIGPNPNHILPGQVLTPPAPTHPVPPTHQEK